MCAKAATQHDLFFAAALLWQWACSEKRQEGWESNVRRTIYVYYTLEAFCPSAVIFKCNARWHRPLGTYDIYCLDSCASAYLIVMRDIHWCELLAVVVAEPEPACPRANW